VLLTVCLWNLVRCGWFVPTTAAQFVAPLVAAKMAGLGVPPSTGSPHYDEIARIALQKWDMADVAVFNALLFKSGLTAPDIAVVATKMYVRLWLHHPRIMLGFLWNNVIEWRWLFVNDTTYNALPDWCRRKYLVGGKNLFYVCGGLPAVWAALAALRLVGARRLMLVFTLLAFSVLTSAFFAAFNFERRYVLCSMAPLLLILALSVGEAMTLCSSARKALASS
jgi:hypothetical protein